MSTDENNDKKKIELTPSTTPASVFLIAKKFVKLRL